MGAKEAVVTLAAPMAAGVKAVPSTVVLEVEPTEAWAVVVRVVAVREVCSVKMASMVVRMEEATGVG